MVCFKMGYAEAKQFETNLIPIIDIAPLRDGSDPIRVAKSLHRASSKIGFIYIKGHGISEKTVENAYKSALTFFRASYSEKASVAVSTKHRGWLGPNRSKMEDNARPDLKESFIWGLESELSKQKDDHYVRGKNKWPSFAPDIQKPSIHFFNEVNKVARHLLRGFAIGLEIDENFFLRKTSQPLSRASYVYYPPQPKNMGKEQFGAGPHTDFGVLTILRQDSIGGLQVKDLNGDWIHAPPIDGSLIVNVGDLLSRWTDGIYRSTPHRVINSSNLERLSLVLAFDPDPDTMIDAKEVFGTDYLAKEKPISCGDYLSWRFNKAFS